MVGQEGCERRGRDDQDVYPYQKPERDGKRQVNGWQRLNQKWKEARMNLTRKRARHANRCVKANLCPRATKLSSWLAARWGGGRKKMGSGCCAEGPAGEGARKSVAPKLRVHGRLALWLARTPIQGLDITSWKRMSVAVRCPAGSRGQYSTVCPRYQDQMSSTPP